MLSKFTRRTIGALSAALFVSNANAAIINLNFEAEVFDPDANFAIGSILTGNIRFESNLIFDPLTSSFGFAQYRENDNGNGLLGTITLDQYSTTRSINSINALNDVNLTPNVGGLAGDQIGLRSTRVTDTQLGLISGLFINFTEILGPSLSSPTGGFLVDARTLPELITFGMLDPTSLTNVTIGDLNIGGAGGLSANFTSLTDASLDPSPVPVPGALPLLATGLASLGFVRRRKRAKAKHV